LRARMSVRSGYCAPAPVFQAAPAGNWSAGNWLPRQARNLSTYRPEKGGPRLPYRTSLDHLPRRRQRIRPPDGVIRGAPVGLAIGPDHVFAGLVGVVGAGGCNPWQRPFGCGAVIRAPQTGGGTG